MNHRPAPVHDAMIPHVEFKVLGQLSALAGETRVKLGGKRQRLVLAVLLANANRVVSQDALLDAVWNGQLPEGGPRTLHTYISILRKTLGEGIDRDGSGYILEIAPDQLDAYRFEGLVADARTKVESDPQHANELLRRGLSLWTGTAYGDLGHEMVLVPEVTRLTDARAAALETRFETDLLLGRHEEMVPEVEAVLHEHPYRENVAAILMLAQYRSGRQAEALRTYRRMRERLVDELGIEPGPRLQDLELRILKADPHLNAPSTNARATVLPRGARGYELHEQIGAAKFGDRFRGFQSTLGREVSVVVVDEEIADSPRFIQRFEAEMQVVSQFEHPHLAPVFDYWRDPHQACVVSPFYRGGNVESALGEGKLSIASVVRLCDQLAGALGYLHRHGYTHGNVDAAAVFLDEDLNPFLADTGLAGLVTAESQNSRAEDVRQLGELIFRALTLHPADRDPRISRWRHDLPTDLDHAVSRALHPNPELRFERVEDFARALRQSVGLDVMAVMGEVRGEQGPDVERRNPYKSLRAFHEVDAADFHGRDVLIDEMVEAISRTRLLAVVGPSGSGKSSVVRAGLLPKLRRGEVVGSEQWLITDMFPGTHPFDNLEAALLRVAPMRPPNLYERLTADATGLGNVVEQLLPDEKTGLVILIDQFEELFSLSASPSERDRFLDALTNAVLSIDSRLHVILTLRADFFDQPLQHPEFAQVLRSSVVTVSPPTRDGLARAISEPAKRAGVSLEPGLVTRIVDDVREQPGGLPLLQFALTELFARREGDLLTQAAYEALGGVGGTLARRAEETYSSLLPDAREATKQMFLRLVTVDEFADDTRRRVRQSELLDIDVDRTVMSVVIQRFGALRFLSFDRDAASRTPTVELAHEAILREWHRLRTWIDERREDLLIHRRIQMTVQDWRDSDRDSGYLLRGSRLEQALVWIGRTDIAVSEQERRLVEESIAFDVAERSEREALEHKAARRRKAAIGILAGAAVVASVLGIYAIGQRGNALQSASEATARELSQAAIAITEDDPELGILLAAEAFEISRQAGAEPLPETLTAMWSAYVANRVVLTIPGVGSQAVAFSPSGSMLAVDSIDNTVSLRDATTGAELGRLSNPPDEAGRVFAIEFSPGGEWVAVARSGLEGGVGTVEIFDVESREQLHSWIGDRDAYLALSFSEVNQLTAIGYTGPGDYTGTLDLTTWVVTPGISAPNAVHQVFSDGQITAPSVEYLPGTNRAVIGLEDTNGGSSRLAAIDPLTGEESWDLSIAFDNPLFALSPEGDRVAVLGHAEKLVAVYDVASGQQVFQPVPHQDPQSISWSRDGELVAVAGNDSNVTLLDADTGEVTLTLSGHPASVWSTSFHPHDDIIASVSVSGETRLWTYSPTGATDASTQTGSSDIHSLHGYMGDLVIATLVDQSAVVVIDSTLGETSEPYFDWVYPSAQVALDAQMIAGVTSDGRASIKSIPAGSIVAELPGCSTPIGISPDARYVVLTSYEGPSSCDETDRMSGIYDVAAETFVVDFGDQYAWVAAVTDDQTFDATRYAAVTFLGDRFRAEIWSLEPPRLVATAIDELTGAAYIFPNFGPEGRHLALGTNGPNVVVLDVAALKSGAAPKDSLVFDRKTHDGNAPLGLLTNNGRLVTSGFDGFYRFWDLETGALILEVEAGATGGHGAHTFTPDFAYFYYEDANGIIRRMPTDVDKMIELATSSVTRSLTDDECRRYLHTDGCQ